MRRIVDLPLSVKTAVPIVVLLLVAVGVATLGLRNAAELKKDMRDLVQENARAIKLALTVEAGLGEIAVNEKNSLVSNKPEQVQGYWEMLRSERADLGNELNKLVAAAKGVDARLISELDRQARLYMDQAELVLQSVKSGRTEAALALSMGEAREARRAALAAIREVVTIEEGRLDQATANAEALFRSMLVISGMTTAFGLLLAIGLAVWMTMFQVARPLVRITDAMGRLAAGETEIEIGETGRRDEVGRLADALSVFRRNAIERLRLEAAQVAEQEAKERRTAAVETLVRSFETDAEEALRTVGVAATQLDATAQSMAAIAEETSRQAGSAAAAAEQTTANVQTVASAAEEMAASIREIIEQVSRSKRIADEAADQARRTDQTVVGLAEATRRIGTVIELIQSIAAQTNLLALNATIEAARAGEVGRGFAVVAGEVKILASQTARATDEISGQIAAVQQATEDAVMAIRGISETIAQVNMISGAIAAAMEQQGASTAEISRSVTQAAQGTQAVSENVVQVTEAASQTGAAATQVLVSAQELTQRSDLLRQQVERFLGAIKAA